MTEWQPIETAPKDGTRVILGFFRPNVFETLDQKPQAGIVLGRYVRGDVPPLCASAWQTESGQGFQWEPTHWMPLPEPPAAKPSESSEEATADEA
jgi:hypothetical protein